MPSQSKGSKEIDDSELHGTLLGVGHPLLDISCEVDRKMVMKYALRMDDTIMAEERHKPIYSELKSRKNVKYIAGGSTLNTLRVAQWMFGSQRATSFIGSIGNDACAKKLISCVKEDGVEAHFQVEKDTPTGKCACLIVDKERSLVTDLQAAKKYKLEHLKQSKILSVCSKARIIYISSFMLNGNLDTVMYLAKNCSQTIFCMNLSAPFIMAVPHLQGALKGVLPYIDVLFGNEVEAKAFSSMMRYKTDDIEKIAALASSEKSVKAIERTKMVIFTKGPECTVVAQDGDAVKYEVPTLDYKKIVDTNGAGDAFVGGFLSQLIAGHPSEICVDAGHFASQTIIQTSGTALPYENPSYCPKNATLFQGLKPDKW
eukprot:CAMPEP_0185273034 /NCGR_PEP_ID=MMETSP1359-20130426/48643_1 /TAXON_ID=552665 /ORGANISM="Bigelowiella longifila, Strain CCMP242" /LENGTH=371 /DNA_ID=CAMNT_0027865525 /DNA_START=109 /DNA_END=1221 /DNA_ORIENTATION=-